MNALEVHMKWDVLTADHRADEAAENPKGHDLKVLEEHLLKGLPLRRSSAFIDQIEGRQVAKVNRLGRVGKNGAVQSIQAGVAIDPSFDMPEIPSFTKAATRRPLEVTRTAPLATTGSQQHAVEVIRNLVCHRSPPFSRLSLLLTYLTALSLPLSRNTFFSVDALTYTRIDNFL